MRQAPMPQPSMRLFRASRSAGLAAALLALVAAGPAAAHAHLERASPPADGTVRAAPDEVVLTFTERLEAKFSRIRVRDGSGKAVATGETRAAGSDGRSIAVSLPKLAPGTYTVSWTATSVDTHRTSGTFAFTLSP